MTVRFVSVQSLVARGELLDAAAFAERLGWTPRALGQALRADRVFFVEHEGRRLYPAFFANPRYGRRELQAVCKLLGDLPGGGKLQFFLNPRGALSRVSPLEALARGQFAAVKAAAEGFAE